MGWRDGTEDGTGEQPGPGSWRPPRRDPLLAGFVKGGDWDRFPPSPDLALALAEASGKDYCCPGARHDELIGLLRQWHALESWAAAGKLGVLRALIAEEELPYLANTVRAWLPQEWSRALTHEVALALGMSVISADGLMWAAWDLRARLPEIGRMLAEGKLTLAKARAVNDALAPLSDQDVILAEELVAERLAQEPGMTYGQAEKTAAAVAVLVDPESAAARRQGAEEDNARVTMFREPSGAAGLSGRDLPVDQALTANVRVTDRAQEYKDCGAFPQARMDQLRAMAYLDLLNDITADQRIAYAQAAARPQPAAPGPDDPDADDRGPDGGGPADDRGPADPRPADPGAGGWGPDGGPADGESPSDGGGPAGHGDPVLPEDGAPCCPCRECDGSCNPPDDDEDRDSGPGAPGTGVSLCPCRECDESRVPSAAGAAAPERPATAVAPDGPALPPRLTDLVIPLVTLLGWDQRPGESHGLGPLDPELCRSLAALAAASRHTRLCLTVTDDDGIAIGHGCAHRNPPRQKPGSTERAGPAGPPATLPARLNLTITAGLLAGLTPTGPATGPPGGPGWSLTYRDPGPPGGHGTWSLTLPDGGKLTVALEPIPTFGCDHRHESRGYQPNDTLRHLVQVRDRTCTLPVCNRHARECDFEHATPYDQGGRTCACNAGARSRACHQVKQAKGWKVTQPAPGFHQWETPAGRTYTQGPYRYPT